MTEIHWKKGKGKREKVFADRLPLTRDTLYQMVAEFAGNAGQVWYDVDEAAWRDFQVQESQPDILTLYARNARGTPVDLVDLAIQTGGDNHLCVDIVGEVEIACSLRDDLLSRLGMTETPQPAKTAPNLAAMPGLSPGGGPVPITKPPSGARILTQDYNPGVSAIGPISDFARDDSPLEMKRTDEGFDIYIRWSVRGNLRISHLPSRRDEIRLIVSIHGVEG